jgi:anti-sigma-K factor RskA
MFDEDQDTLAAEYVLGTLSGEEREHAEALLTFDPGFEAAVRQWERRLGELNVMVEAVEPPAEIWDKIKKDINPAEAVGTAPALGAEPPPHVPRDLDSPATAAELASGLSFDDVSATADHAEAAAETHPPEIHDDAVVVPPLPELEPQHAEQPSADVIVLARRVRRWRGLTVAMGAIAALLAIYVALSQFMPDVIPPQLRTGAARMIARSEGSGRAAQDRLVAVLQQQPTAPAFLLTLDLQRRALYVRRISATPENGRSYELWLISSRFGTPRSLGVVGADEFTQRTLPANYDVDTLRGASYAVSLEPAGGSPNGTPTGPVLFTGKAVESLPASPPDSNT